MLNLNFNVISGSETGIKNLLNLSHNLKVSKSQKKKKRIYQGNEQRTKHVGKGRDRLLFVLSKCLHPASATLKKVNYCIAQFIVNM